MLSATRERRTFVVVSVSNSRGASDIASDSTLIQILTCVHADAPSRWAWCLGYAATGAFGSASREPCLVPNG